MKKIIVRCLLTSIIALVPFIVRAEVAEVEPNDPEFKWQANLNDFLLIPDANGGPDALIFSKSHINAERAWSVSTSCNSKVIAVLSTGVDVNHEDLRGAFVGPSYFRNFTGQGALSDITDRAGTGTVVSGVIAARTNNSIGVSGVCWNARILPIKVLADNGYGDFTMLAKGIDYAVQLGVKIIVIPIGDMPIQNNPVWSQQLDQTYQAMLRAEARGALIIAPTFYSGDELNQNGDLPVAWNFSNTISVTGLDINAYPAFNSAFGSSYADIAAPAAGTYTTVSKDFIETYYPEYTGTKYGSVYDSDAAAANVAAAAAMVWHLHPTWDYARVKQQLMGTVRRIDDPEYPTSRLSRSGGTLDLYKALTETQVPAFQLADLTVEKFFAGSPATGGTDAAQFTAIVGQNIPLTTTFTNRGPVAAGPFTISFVVDGTIIEAIRMNGMRSGERVSRVSRPWKATARTHTLRVILDSDKLTNTKEVAESNEANNIVEKPIAVTVPPAPSPTPAPKSR